MMADKHMADLDFSRQPISGRRKRTWFLRLAILGAVGLMLTWEVISRSVAAYLADVAPAAALWLNAQEPTALLNVAGRMLSLSEEVGRSDARTLGQRRQEIRALVESAVMNEPVNAQAARILGQLADATKKESFALQFMDAAVHFSLHETAAMHWVMRKKAEMRDYKEAIYYADIILRIHPELGTYIFRFLAKMTENSQTNNELKVILADNPPWRARFLAALPDSITDARAPLYILLALRTGSAPPTSMDIEPYLKFLINHRLFDLAYYAWLQFLPLEDLRNVRLLFNGSFEVPSSSGSFDWTITQGTGVTIDIVQREDDSAAHALLVQFQHGRVDFHSVTQLIILSPGDYKLGGKYKGELTGKKGIKWRITCVNETSTQIGEGPLITGAVSAWKNFEFSFTVPDTDCRAQYVRLDLDARIASERLLSGSVLFDELEILRLDGPPT